MDPSNAATTIASQGLLGAMLAVVAWVAWSKDKEVKSERQARIEDAKSYNELALKLQAQALNAVSQLSDILEELKKMVPVNRRLGGE